MVIESQRYFKLMVEGQNQEEHFVEVILLVLAENGKDLLKELLNQLVHGKKGIVFSLSLRGIFLAPIY